MPSHRLPSAILLACILAASLGSSSGAGDNRPASAAGDGSWTTAVAWTADGKHLVAAAGEAPLVLCHSLILG